MFPKPLLQEMKTVEVELDIDGAIVVMALFDGIAEN
jgi:hypothetical protein